MKIDPRILSAEDRARIEALGNPHVEEVVETYVNHLGPARVTVITDDAADIQYVREQAVAKGEERPLAMDGHTVHFDGYHDQGRDKEATKVLIPPGMKMSRVIGTKDREEGLEEVLGIARGIMAGKECLVRFFCLGPLNSEFSICAMQLTDSFYVAHSEDILYRSGYEEFKRLGGRGDFFYFVHSAGELDERGCSKNVDRRRIYIDLLGNRVFTVNNQYAGNSLGLKKLALRLGIHKAIREDWLTEHMFIMGAQPEGKDRVTYFTGAFPSACGKTSTAMIPGQLIVGDDIAYMRKGDDGLPYTVNIEQGIFGIIEDVNPRDDPLIHETLTTPRELIFSNVLVNNNTPYWLGMGKELPDEGENFSGQWRKGKKDDEGNEIGPAHKNARYTVRISELANCDDRLHDPRGVPISGVIYGGRDSDTSVPVYQSLDWTHGVMVGATIESETTAATLGKAGVRKFNPMANLDFLVVPLGKYIQAHLDFGKSLANPPLVFATNYFIRDAEGGFMNEKVDKKVWLYWMEGRVHGDYGALETPVGYIPKFEDLVPLFKQVFDREYTRGEYDMQFSIRVDKFMEKMDRMKTVYADEDEVPAEFSDCMDKIAMRLADAREQTGLGAIPPSHFE
ncbi:MAG: phosphoenolpyruvate carboxykinase (GTP) [Desulfatibacillaceae bacterium]